MDTLDDMSPHRLGERFVSVESRVFELIAINPVNVLLRAIDDRHVHVSVPVGLFLASYEPWNDEDP